MQLTDKFAQTFRPGDRIEFTDVRGDRFNITLEASRDGLGLGAQVGPGVTLCVIEEGAFGPGIAKLHSFKRGRGTKVQAGDRLEGLDRTKVVPRGTILRDDDYGPLVWSGADYWNAVASERDGQRLNPGFVVGEVVFVP